MKSGTKTLRFRADGNASIEDVDDKMVKALERINGLLETYMGINDADLGKTDENDCKRCDGFSSSTNLGSR